MRAGRPRSQAKADAVGGRRPGAGDRYFFIINIDAQDAQDERDERFLHQKPARAMIRADGCSGLQASRGRIC